MSNGIYKAVLKSRCEGQLIVNTLWYRSVLEGTFASDLLIDGATALAESIIAHIWVDVLRELMPSSLTLDEVTVTGYNDQYELLYSNPVTVNPETNLAAGSDSATQVWLPLANCININFNLENRLITNPLLKPPVKGLIALSPVPENVVDNDGTVNAAGTAAYGPVADAVAEPLPWDFVSVDLPFTNWTPSVGIPSAFLPVRAKTWEWTTPQIIGGITVFKHIEITDVLSASVRRLAGYRRSRRVE